MVLKLSKAEKSFGKKTVLQQVSFELKTGEILGLFGSNGSGKSTLLKMLFGVQKGTIDFSLYGEKTKASEVIESELIAYVPQHPFLPESAKVRDIIPMYFSEAAQQDKIFYDPTIAAFDHNRIRELSQGQRKYFETILVGNLDHPILMLDEPFSMLEPLQIEALKKFLLQKKKEKGILITDHYYSEVLDISDINIVLKDGIGYPISSRDELVQFEYLRK